jgi:FPC/CPF motif-containing protein YcgG
MMPRIKLIKVYDVKNSCDYCDHYVKDIAVDDMSPWQEVTEKELQWLQCWQGRNQLLKKNVAIVVLQDITSEETVQGYISDIKKFVKDEEIKQKERDKKYAEAEKKRKLLAEQKKIERAKKLLEKSGIKVD